MVGGRRGLFILAALTVVGLVAVTSTGVPVFNVAGSARPPAMIVASAPVRSLRDLGPDTSQLTVTFTVRPTRVEAGSPVQFALTMAAEHALGAFGYDVKFGDGTSRTIAVPQYCLAPPGRPEHATWRFSHRYAKAGRYRVVVLGYLNCTPLRATKSVVIVVSE
jgi:hypothetical protein